MDQALGTFTVVIPARYASTRLPGKPLVEIDGQPMIAHVHALAVASGAARVVIATDDRRVLEAARGFGAEAQMTSATHRVGTERVCEVVEVLGLADDAVVVNVQGDEPLLPPALVQQVARNLAARPDTQMSTLCVPIRRAEELFDPSAVKVVCAADGHALYFSRAPIPWHRDHLATAPGTLPPGGHHFRHLGIYAYRAGFLRRYVRMAPAAIEEVESLEQLRALHAGARVHVEQAVEAPGTGVDTPHDLAAVRAVFATRGRGATSGC